MPAQVPIGLDIGSCSIRAVEVGRTKSGTVINNFGRIELPDGAMVGGVVKDDKAVTSALKKLWAGQRFRTKSVVLGVTHQQVVVREVEIANLPPKEMRSALPFQVRDVLPLPVEQAILDFYPLEHTESLQPESKKTSKDGNGEKPAKKETVRGLLVAAPKEAVIHTVDAVERAGLHVEGVDLSCFAALRAAAHATSDAEAVVDVGANGTNIIIHIEGVPLIVRTIPRGGTDVTKMLANRLNIEFDEAEKLKCRVGLSEYDASDAASIMRDAVRPLISEIRSSVSYYTNSQPDRKVARLALVGGASDLPGFAAQLSEAMNVPAFIANPLQHVSDSRQGGRHDILGRFRSSAAVCVGLTLGGGR